jgi:hypothetical protein
MKKTALLTALTLVLALNPVVFAEASGHQLNMANRMAELDGYRRMAGRTMGLQIAAESGLTTVDGFVKQSDEIATHLDHFIKEIKITDKRELDIGICEVTVQVTLQAVVTELQSECSQYYKGGKWTTKSFESIKTYTQDTVLTEIGRGAVSGDSVVPELKAIRIVNPKGEKTRLPDIFYKYKPQRLVDAIDTAEMDAHRKLVEQIYGLRITANMSVKDLDSGLLERDVKESIRSSLKGMRTDDIRYLEDGRVEVQVSVTLKQVVSIFKKACDEYRSKTGKLIKLDKFEEYEKQTKRRTVTVLGYGSVTSSVDTVRSGGTNDSASPAVGSGDSSNTTHTEKVIIKQETEVIDVEGERK